MRGIRAELGTNNSSAVLLNRILYVGRLVTSSPNDFDIQETRRTGPGGGATAYGRREAYR